MKLSVVIATHNRHALLTRLLRQLAEQTLPAGEYEVCVVDDGSSEPATNALRDLRPPYALRVARQSNAGAAAARHAGALMAQGEVLVILDDDMQVGPHFLERHLRAHASGRKVAIGRISADPQLSRMPLFERWHQRLLDRNAERFAAGAPVLGNHFFTGNVSLRREDYLTVGGFDHTLGNSEDVELGLRLERAGVEFTFLAEAESLHGSDHTDVICWRRRAFRYGQFDRQIAGKHPERRHASPWRFAVDLHPALRPFAAIALAAPSIASRISGAALAASTALDRLGADEAALAGTTLAYAMEYFRGLGDAAGGAKAAALELGSFLSRFERGHLPALVRMSEAIRADQATMRHYETRYGHASPSVGHLGSDLLRKIGLQLLAAYRVMRALDDAGHERLAQIVSRWIRHAYGSDLHWRADFAPGVMVVHGMGLAVSHAARVGPGCILFHHVTLGWGTDPLTGDSGAPALEANVHVGPGATLLGPIRIGEGSKIMPGAVVRHSVPKGSLVEVAEPTWRARPQRNVMSPDAEGREHEVGR
jgi:serine acetyltransferase/GT2 family glycosyltransferase